jgi:hypothetical protein
VETCLFAEPLLNNSCFICLFRGRCLANGLNKEIFLLALYTVNWDYTSVYKAQLRHTVSERHHHQVAGTTSFHVSLFSSVGKPWFYGPWKPHYILHKSASMGTCMRHMNPCEILSGDYEVYRPQGSDEM